MARYASTSPATSEKSRPARFAHPCAHRQGMTSPPPNSAGWSHSPERSNMLMLRTMSWISLHLGRPVGRVVLHLIAAYFLLFAPASRAGSRQYLRRILQRPVRWSDIYKHFFWFASTIHDRVYLLNQRFDLF